MSTKTILYIHGDPHRGIPPEKRLILINRNEMTVEEALDLGYLKRYESIHPETGEITKGFEVTSKTKTIDHAKQPIPKGPMRGVLR